MKTSAETILNDTSLGSNADRLVTQSQIPQPQIPQPQIPQPQIPQPQIPLSQIPLGKTGIVMKITAPDTIRLRLEGLGLATGVEFKLLQGDDRHPYVLAVDETRIAIASELAQAILCR